jgi:hypothetical protein
MNDVGADLPGTAYDMRDRQAVAGADIAVHRNAGEAKRQRWHERFERLFGAFAAGRAVRDKADAMAACRLFAREVNDVPLLQSVGGARAISV